ncbi:MAG: hypothetical protein IJ977_08205 [Fibrobacter sp.]|uniref:hypothetical protein n=1 Tax=Fibrobacter sp. TaxID=35828 RepID=UPI0025BFDD37|nr:hypothetical protein [Fibrobacter sp.]MBR2075219.1 hypothetical protein [Fibrobacter sp.]MBR4008885.1 hypothetical protein [Fibrobacter sp.]
MDLFIILVTAAGMGILLELLYVHSAITRCTTTLVQQRDNMAKLAKRIDRDSSIVWLQQPSKCVALERLKSLHKK